MNIQGMMILLILVSITLAVLAKEKGGKECWCDGVQPQQGVNGTSNTTREIITDSFISQYATIPTTLLSTSELPGPTSEQELDPFPPGDVLNDPWLKEMRFCFHCYSETKLQGLRNFWPYLYQFPAKYWSDGRKYYMNRILIKSGEIAVDPILRARLYCAIVAYPIYQERALLCMPGNDTLFQFQWNKSPIGMMQNSIPLSVLNATLAFLTLMLGIFGNILIIIAILTKKELKSSTNLILLGMAVADCLNSVTIISYAYLETFAWTITNPVLGPVGCAIMETLKEFGQLAAINHLVTLSFERYFAICWPMKQHLKFTRKKTILIMIANWFLAGIQTIPSVVLRIPDESHYADYMCYVRNFSYPRWIYIVCDLTIYVVLPLPILCFNYICVVRSLLTSIKRSRQMTGDLSGQTQAEQARLKLTYMMIALVAIYIVTVTPGRIMDALNGYYIIGNTGIFFIKKVKGTIDMLRGINSWTNVVVYTVISKQFRTAFKEILCGCCDKSSVTTPGPGDQDGTRETPAGTSENQV